MTQAAVLDRSAVRFGTARGRYFRENFAQGGVGLVQIIPELTSDTEPELAHDSSTNALIRRYRFLKS